MLSGTGSQVSISKMMTLFVESVMNNSRVLRNLQYLQNNRIATIITNASVLVGYRLWRTSLVTDIRLCTWLQIIHIFN